jgi:hypothetical protein
MEVGVGLLYPGTTAHQLRPNILDMTDSSDSKMAGEPGTALDSGTCQEPSDGLGRQPPKEPRCAEPHLIGRSNEHRMPST